MINNISRDALRTRLAVLALLVVFHLQPSVHAKKEISIVFNTVSWGMVRGQTTRFSVSNPLELSEWERSGPVFFQVMLVDETGAVIATSEERAVPPGEFRSVDFDRDDLPLAGSIGGRVQARAEIRYRSFAIIDRTQMTRLPTSIELIDDATGQTAVLVAQKPNEILVAGSHSPVPPPAPVDLSVIVYANRGLIGLTNGETLRVNALHPGDPRGHPDGPMRARVSLFDSNGALLARSGEATIGPGEFHSFDFDRAAITASGESVGGRLQLRVSVEAAPTHPSSFTQDPRAAGLLPTSLELVANSTGRTTAVWVTVGFFETEPSQKP